MLDWNRIDTVLLDMDGTLLDLNFDNHFWLEHVPRRYGEKHGLTLDEARHELLPRFRRVEGTLDWYCVDYWTRELGLDIALLKEEVEHLIAVHPDVPEFLTAVRTPSRRVALVTNAHMKSLDLKMRKTQLGGHFDEVICSHDLGLPKEQPEFWDRLQARLPYDPERALLVDDSLPVLRAARTYGIGYLLAVRNPDSRRPPKDVEEFDSVSTFGEITP